MISIVLKISFDLLIGGKLGAYTAFSCLKVLDTEVLHITCFERDRVSQMQDNLTAFEEKDEFVDTCRTIFPDAFLYGI
nr:hypothetical protein [uncultured Prevotella sp.]